MPSLRDTTTQGLVDLALEQAGALRDCNSDKVALRAWMDSGIPKAETQ